MGISCRTRVSLSWEDAVGPTGKKPPGTEFKYAFPPPSRPATAYLHVSGLGQPVTEELLPPEKMLVPTSGQAIDFRVELKRLLDSIMANYGQFMEMLVR